MKLSFLLPPFPQTGANQRDPTGGVDRVADLFRQPLTTDGTDGEVSLYTVVSNPVRPRTHWGDVERVGTRLGKWPPAYALAAGVSPSRPDHPHILAPALLTSSCDIVEIQSEVE